MPKTWISNVIYLTEELVLNMNNVSMVRRPQWNAHSSKEDAQYMTMPVSHVFIHHTMMNECFSQIECIKEMRKIQHIHQDINGNCSCYII
ncbi:hypothetical protein DPMN_027972 [Dreissena polymorpha]|uniref:Uncharacterized protein n=1 Tax=Dreissena polymorpha TaxID=45954 RepID=A0A9D4LW97_DREPO|nr:hypothetical protein DPMN_027972 [Dreissena polymorpha]